MASKPALSILYHINNSYVLHSRHRGKEIKKEIIFTSSAHTQNHHNKATVNIANNKETAAKSRRVVCQIRYKKRWGAIYN